MTPPTDFGTCPSCHRTGAEFYPESIEVIPGAAGINLFRDRGLYTAEFEGQTDLEWSDSRTVGYRCGSCFAPLPEEHQAFLDQLLGNNRVKE